MTTAAPTTEASRALNRRIMGKLMPLLIMAYIMAFLDRTNIGLAKRHLEADLGISAAAYGLGAGLFFLAYASFEVPSNLIMNKVGARAWITRIMVTWGLISAAMAFVQGPASFYVLRVLLGFAEAGLFPGVMLYLTYWFGREMRARANGYFLVAVCVANIVGAPLSGALLGLDGLGGLKGWQWMFLIEGIPAALLAIVVWKLLPNGPEDAKWLSPAERETITSTLARERAATETSGNHGWAAAAKDPVIWLTIAIYFTHQIAVYSLTYFLPSIIGSWGIDSDLTIGLLTALPWVAAAIGAAFLPRYADRPTRSKLLLLMGFLAMTGGLAIGALGGNAVALLGFSLAAFAFFVVQSILFTVPAERLTGVALAAGLALVNTLGILGGFVGPYVMGMLESSTGKPTAGLWFVVALTALGTLLVPLLRFTAPHGGKVEGSDLAAKHG